LTSLPLFQSSFTHLFLHKHNLNLK
jgi:hypothetical protein